MDIEAVFSHTQVRRVHSFVCGVLIGLTLLLAWSKRQQLRTVLQNTRASLVAFCCSEFSKLDRQAKDAFEWELSQVVVRAAGALLVVFFIRSLMVVSEMNSGLLASMHLSCVLLQIVCLFVCQFPHLVRPSSLVGWNILVFILHTLPVLWEPSFVQGSLGRTLPGRVLLSVTARYDSLSIALNVMFYLVVNFAQLRLHRTATDGPAVESVESNYAVQPFLEMVLLTGLALIVRHVLYRTVRMSLELKTSTVELSAVSRLLHGFCDAVVELDEDLKLTDARQLSTILLHGTPQDSPEKADFLNYFTFDDVQRVRDCLERPGCDLPPLALNAKMIDSMASEVHVELLHVPFSNAEGRSCHYVGMREVDVLSALAPLQDDRVEVTTSFLNQSAPSIVFKGTTLEVVDADPIIGELCRIHMGTSIFNLTLMDFDESSSRTTLCGQVQFAINAFVSGLEWAQEPIPLEDLHVLGRKVIAVTFDQATDLLGSLILSGPQSQLTFHNLQNLGGGSGDGVKALRKSRSSSKGGKSSRRSSWSARSTSEAAPLSRLSPVALGKARSSL